MKLIVERNVHYSIRDMEYTVEKEEVYENVDNIRAEGKQVRHYINDQSFEYATLILFEDENHKGLMANYVYIGPRDTFKLRSE